MTHLCGRFCIIALMLGAIAVSLPATAEAVYDQDGQRHEPRLVKGRVTVQFEDDVDLNNAAKAFGRVSFGLPSLDAVLADVKVDDYRKIFPWRNERPKTNSGMHDLTRFYELEFSENIPVQTVINALRQNPNIRMVEAVWEMPLLATPNDPSWSSQWAMEPPGPDPYFYDAWDIEAGSDSVIYGCIDSGVNYEHSDLKENIWVNPGEDVDGDGVVYDVDDLNGVDDDGNGVVDDLIGYDFLSDAGSAVWPGEDGGTRDTDPNDFNGHGTHVAGIAAAATNNGINVTGAAGGWFGGHRSYRGARIMCLRVGYTASDGRGYIDPNDAAAAIDYATMMGADVINASWGGSSVTGVASANAMAAGVTFCHAAGNNGDQNQDAMDNQPGMLSVASVGPNSDTKSGFSNYGYWIDVCAPGSDILSTYSSQYTPTIATIGGTSMASPMVAGLALLIRSAMPSLTKAQVDSLIINTADPVEYANEEIYHYKLGSGRINAHSALLGLASAQFTADQTDGNVPLTVNFTDLSPYSPTTWDWSFGTGVSSTDQNPAYTYTQPGVYDVSLIVDDTSSLGLGEEHLRRYVWARADSIMMDSVEIQAGNKVVLPVYLRNTAQVSQIQFAFQLEGHDGQKVRYDSFSVAGLRTEYFEQVSENANVASQQKFSIMMTANTGANSTYMVPDTGAILDLHLTVTPSAAAGQVVTIDTVTVNGKNAKVVTPLGDYWPEFQAGKVVVRTCGHGDANCDENVSVSDLTMLVDYMFRGGPTPDVNGGDVNDDGFINISDINYLVDYLFRSGPPPPA